MGILIVEEDAERLYLLKEPGIPVFPPHNDRQGDCLLRRFVEVGGGAGEWPRGFEGGIAHRLDTATGGWVVAARSPEGLVALRAAFASGALRKFYRFRSEGEVAWRDRVVTTEIGHHQRKTDRMVVRGGPRTTHRGRWYPAWTRFTSLGPPWWQAEIQTGVMHQIRVHAASVGLPLTGDVVYGGAPGRFVLVHERLVGPGWATPPLPAGWLADVTGARVTSPG